MILNPNIIIERKEGLRYIPFPSKESISKLEEKDIKFLIDYIQIGKKVKEKIK